MSPRFVLRFLLAALVVLSASSALAQMPNPFGTPISVENAKKAAAAALAEMRKINVLEAVAVTDAAGDLVYFERMNNTQSGSVEIALAKARSAAQFKRPTKVWQDVVGAGGGGLRILGGGLRGIVPSDGGIPLVVDGKIVGAIGLSGGTADQDGQCAKAGADSVK